MFEIWGFFVYLFSEKWENTFDFFPFVSAVDTYIFCQDTR